MVDILRHKKANIKQARLLQGSPDWDALSQMTWEQVEDGHVPIDLVLRLSASYSPIKGLTNATGHLYASNRISAGLERGKIHYTLQSCRDEAIMVLVTVPGERWEVEFLADGSVEVERFISDGEIYGEDI